MARSRSSYLNELSTADLKQLLEARQRIDVLEKEKARLLKELAAIEGELASLVAGVEKKPARAAAAKKIVRKKKAAGKKTTRKKVTRATTKKATKKPAKKVTKKATKKVTKKAVKKVTKKAAKKVGKKTTKKKVTARKSAANQPRLEDIVVGIIQKVGKPVSYQDIMSAIQAGKLFTSKSKNFDNVLRRTLSTSKLVKRAGRGIYDLA